MKDNVIPIKSASDEAHLSGVAICLQCGYEHVTVAPVGVEFMECPKCGVHKTVMKYPCEPAEKPMWQCTCGGKVFYLTPDSINCYMCGIEAKGF